MLPLYDKDSIAWETRFKEANTAHIGLLFDKFPHGEGWADATNRDASQRFKLADEEKKGFFKKIIGKYADALEQNTLSPNLGAALKRQQQLIDHLNGCCIKISTDWRMVSGLGASHPFETGFIWHRTLSVPYLPGSSVKGLLKAWAEQWSGPKDEEKIEQIRRLFGTGGDNDGQAGAIIVFDALPDQPPKSKAETSTLPSHPPQLELDIINPHYSDYYKNPAIPPADYLDPSPVFFLAVAPGQSFRFFLAPRLGFYQSKANKDKYHPKEDLNNAQALLIEALEMLGAGGKTAVGYGLFKESDKDRQEREAKAEAERIIIAIQIKAALLDAEAKELGYQGLAAELYKKIQTEQWADKNNSEKFYQAMNTDYLQKIEKEPDPEIKKQAVAIISGLMDTRNKDIMKNPEKKKGKRQDFEYGDKPRNIAIRLKNIKLD